METVPEKLYVMWTSGDIEVARKMVFMYTANAKRNGWWKEICLIIWGPSAKLLAETDELQNQVGVMKELGVELLACKACADMYGVSDKLEELGVDVIYMGQPLTEIIKSSEALLTV